MRIQSVVCGLPLTSAWLCPSNKCDSVIVGWGVVLTRLVFTLLLAVLGLCTIQLHFFESYRNSQPEYLLELP